MRQLGRIITYGGTLKHFRVDTLRDSCSLGMIRTTRKKSFTGVLTKSLLRLSTGSSSNPVSVFQRRLCLTPRMLCLTMPTRPIWALRLWPQAWVYKSKWLQYKIQNRVAMVSKLFFYKPISYTHLIYNYHRFPSRRSAGIPGCRSGQGSGNIICWIGSCCPSCIGGNPKGQ